MKYSYKIIIGLGTGRTGSKSFAELLNMQEGIKFSHEHCKLPWKFDLSSIVHSVGMLFGRILSDNRIHIVGDIAPWYLPYVKYINRTFPNIFKFVCLRRDKNEVVNSYMRKVKYGNHWTNSESIYYDKSTRPSAHDSCYPKYNLPKIEAIKSFYDLYYRRSNSFEKFFNNFKVFDIEVLNNKRIQKSLFNFLEITPPNIYTGIWLNKGRNNKLKCWFYWDELNPPPYIELCYETFKRNVGSDFELVRLNKLNLVEFLPDINPNIDKIILDKTGKNHAFIKADYIRVKLLEKYGGIWIDADAIILKNLSKIKKLINEYDFVCRMTENNYISVNFMASKAGGELISKYSKKIDEYIDNNSTVPSGTFLGSRMITDIYNEFDKSKIFLINVNEVAPIDFKSYKIFFRNDLDIKHFIDDNTICVMLYNRLFPDEFKSINNSQILSGDYLLSKFYKKALTYVT